MSTPNPANADVTLAKETPEETKVGTKFGMSECETVYSSSLFQHTPLKDRHELKGCFPIKDCVEEIIHESEGDLPIEQSAPTVTKGAGSTTSPHKFHDTCEYDGYSETVKMSASARRHQFAHQRSTTRSTLSVAEFGDRVDDMKKRKRLGVSSASTRPAAKHVLLGRVLHDLCDK